MSRSHRPHTANGAVRACRCEANPSLRPRRASVFSLSRWGVGGSIATSFVSLAHGHFQRFSLARAALLLSNLKLHLLRLPTDASPRRGMGGCAGMVLVGWCGRQACAARGAGESDGCWLALANERVVGRPTTSVLRICPQTKNSNNLNRLAGGQSGLNS